MNIKIKKNWLTQTIEFEGTKEEYNLFIDKIGFIT